MPQAHHSLRSALHAELAAYGEDAILKDGGSVRLRALTPADSALTAAFSERLSGRSRRHRFFGAVAKLPTAEIERMTGLDPERTVALAAVVDEHGQERIMGVAEFVPTHTEEPSERAELAVAIADDHQDRGMGTLLLERMAAVVRSAVVVDGRLRLGPRTEHEMPRNVSKESGAP